ncbi:MAG: FAD-dependent oxidoreductase [Candidatus Omnitrophota bacterium]|nr:FAD-dependent oxidoreductase [Candidatus Omnitrophota bacterium]
MIKDPICGMRVESEQFVFEIGGKKYFFCSKGCLEKFKGSSEEAMAKYVYDLVIIGAGPAGLTAAVYASALKIDTFVVTNNIGGQAINSAKIKNYMGFDFISGKELVEKFERQFLHEHYLEHKIDEVVKIIRKGNIFEVFTKDESSITTYALIIATGIKQKTLGVPGEEKFVRRGVSYYYVQDAALFKEADVVVVGGGDFAVGAATELKNAGCKVSLISKDRLTANPYNIKELKRGGAVNIIENNTVIEIKGEDRIDGVVIQSSDKLTTKQVSCSGVFIEMGFIPNTEFCRDLVKLNEKGEIAINPDCSTNVEGIFACGDVTNCFGKRIIIASGEGAKASLSVKKYLLQMGIK